MIDHFVNFADSRNLLTCTFIICQFRGCRTALKILNFRVSSRSRESKLQYSYCNKILVTIIISNSQSNIYIYQLEQKIGLTRRQLPYHVLLCPCDTVQAEQLSGLPFHLWPKAGEGRLACWEDELSQFSTPFHHSVGAHISLVMPKKYVQVTAEAALRVEGRVLRCVKQY